MEEKAEEKKANVMRATTTLRIWDVPLELTRKFIMLAKARYGNKSHLLLRDLMEKAEKYDKLMEGYAKRIEGHEERLTQLEKALREKAEKK